MRTHRIGILGCGSRGCAFAAAVASLDEVELALCIDDDLEAADACARAHGGEAAASWAGQGLDTLIMTQPTLDADRLVAAVQAGSQVLVDPPLARGVVRARRTARAVADAPSRIGMAFAWRFESLVRLLRGIVPEPRFAHIGAVIDPGPPQAPKSVLESAWATPHAALDLLMHLFGAAPAEIVADGGPLPRGDRGAATISVPPRADALAADLYFDREHHASLTVAGGDADPEHGPVVVDLTDGATRVRIRSNWTTAEIQPVGDRSVDPPRLPGVRLERDGRSWLARVEAESQSLRDLVRAFVCPGGSDTPVPGLSDGVRAVALTRAVLAGASSGRTQTLHAA